MGVALVLAITAAVLLGASDLFAARAARTEAPVTVTRTAVGTSALLSPVLLLLTNSAWIGHDLLIGGGAGLCMTLGLIMLYRGYSIARMGIVAPLSSVLLATVPVLWDVFNGVRPGTVAAVGMAVGVVAVVLTSYTPGGAGSVGAGIGLGLASGVAFGVAFTMMGEVTSAAGLAPVIVQRWVALSFLMVLGAVRAEPFVARGVAGRMAVLAGVLGLFAIGALQSAFQRGDLGPVAVASSQFATVAVVLSVVFNHERMRWWQGTGVTTTALAVALIAAGS